MGQHCHLCGKLGDWHHRTPDLLTQYFTARSICKAPTSESVCDRCHWCLKGRGFFWNESKGKWSKLFVRALTVLYQNDRLVFPVLGEPHTEGKDTFPTVPELATRVMIRDWLLDPPEPPFTIAITESGQKYVLPWAQTAYNRDRFPVQFELDTIYIDRAQFSSLLSYYESLLALGFSKSEIDSGEYRSDRLLQNLPDWEPLETVIAQHRGERLLQLISHVAQAPSQGI